MKILIKLPTKSRPQQFLNVLRLLNKKAFDRENISYLVSYDSDDPTMTYEVRNEAIQMVMNIYMIEGTSNNKIHACNRDINEYKNEWDIILLMSDDMIPQVDGWDKIIRQKMQEHFPDTDGALWFNDGYQDRTCTLTIFGKKYYDRFGWLYCPDYSSLFSDNEQTEVGLQLGKMEYFETCIIKHEHFANNSQIKRDKLYDYNESFFHMDQAVYNERNSRNFDL